MQTPSLILALAVAGGTAQAQETRELSAHEHGVSTLNVALEGDQVAMELEAPGMDIVGFEYEAESEEDQARIEEAVATLGEPLTLFVMPEAAGCEVTEATAGLVEEQGDEHADEAGQVDGAIEAEGETHAEAEEAVTDTVEMDDHGEETSEGELHADEEAGESHTEFRATYRLTCADPAAIDSIEFAFFEAFPSAEEVEVQMISDSGTEGFEVERDEPRLDLGSGS